MLSKLSSSTESSSEESEEEEQRTRRNTKRRNITRRSEEPVKPSPISSKKREVKTKLVNTFFKRESIRKNIDSEDLHTNEWSVDWWLGFRIFPLVKHSVKYKERTIGQKEWSTEKSWVARILSTLWIIWIVLCTLSLIHI